MNTILVWLLISLPGYGPGAYSNVPTTTIAQFDELRECERVRTVLDGAGTRQPTRCIQARVAK